jgi:hypothetical protein
MGLHRLKKVVRLRCAFSGRLKPVCGCYAPNSQDLTPCLTQPWAVHVSITQQKKKRKLDELSRRNIMTGKHLFFFAISSKHPLRHCLPRNRVRIGRRSRRQYKKKVEAIKKEKLRKILEGSDDDSETK